MLLALAYELDAEKTRARAVLPFMRDGLGARFSAMLHGWLNARSGRRDSLKELEHRLLDCLFEGGRVQTILAYIGAAVAEIAGCFAFWAWLRLGQSVWWLLPGGASLALFAFLLTLVDAAAAGRTYAAYGGIYIVASLSWLWTIEGIRPDRWDATGAALCVAGAAIILAGPR